MQAWNQTRAVLLAAEVEKAHTFWTRFRGLMFRRALPRGHGLWIRPCRQVHTYWMRFDIDVLFLDRDGRVLRIISRLRPWRVSLTVQGAASVLELPPGILVATGTEPGDRIRFEPESLRAAAGPQA